VESLGNYPQGWEEIRTGEMFQDQGMLMTERKIYAD
jgi:hypothetical protein